MKLPQVFITASLSVLAVSGQASGQNYDFKWREPALSLVEDAAVKGLQKKFAEISEKTGLSVNVALPPDNVNSEVDRSIHSTFLVRNGAQIVFYRCRLSKTMTPMQLGNDISIDTMQGVNQLIVQALMDKESLEQRKREIAAGKGVTTPVEYTFVVLDGELIQVTPENADDLEIKLYSVPGVPVTDKFFEKVLRGYDMACGLS